MKRIFKYKKEKKDNTDINSMLSLYFYFYSVIIVVALDGFTDVTLFIVS